jgi:hypothetical protein
MPCPRDSPGRGGREYVALPVSAAPPQRRRRYREVRPKDTARGRPSVEPKGVHIEAPDDGRIRSPTIEDEARTYDARLVKGREL